MHCLLCKGARVHPLCGVCVSLCACLCVCVCVCARTYTLCKRASNRTGLRQVHCLLRKGAVMCLCVHVRVFRCACPRVRAACVCTCACVHVFDFSCYFQVVSE